MSRGWVKMVSDKVSYCIVSDLGAANAYIGEKGFVLEHYRTHELPNNANVLEVQMTPETADILSALAGTYKNVEELALKLAGVGELITEIEFKKGTAKSLKSYIEEERGKRLTESLRTCIKTSPYLDEFSTEEA